MQRYATKLYKENQIATADPLKMVVMLYDGAIRFLRVSLVVVTKQRINVKRKLKYLEKACKIIEYLQSCLDREQGGEIARNLNDLYDYILVRLTQANFSNDPHTINEVIRLLIPLRDAWEEISHAPLEKRLEAMRNEQLQGRSGEGSAVQEKKMVSVSA
ncbi:MAG: flagellar export chaperone FliS [Thermodesulfovibrionales bacterium]